MPRSSSDSYAVFVRGDGSKVESRVAIPGVRVRFPVAAPPRSSRARLEYAPWRGRMQEGIHRLGSALKGRAGVRAPALSPILVDRLSFASGSVLTELVTPLGVAQPGIERSVRDRKVAGSNPATQTPSFERISRSTRREVPLDRRRMRLPRFDTQKGTVPRPSHAEPQPWKETPTRLHRGSPCARLSSPPG